MFLLRGGVIPRLEISYYCVYIYHFFLSIFLFNILKNKVGKNIFAILAIFLPTTLLTIYGLIVNAEDLYPVIFPTVSIIILYSVVASFFTHKKLMVGILISTVGILLIFLWNSFFLEKIIFERENHYSYDGKKFPLVDKYVQDSHGSNKLLSTLVLNKKTLLEFMYFNCLPCREKIPVLNKLKNQLNERLNILIIVNGAIDDYNDYQNLLKFYSKSSSLNFYFDPDGNLTKSLKIKAFPTEYIIDEKQFIKLVSVGFSADTKNIYINERKKFILKNDL